jgi:protein-S-isoprenylcysteine O-methyltransferase Ste14
VQANGHYFCPDGCSPADPGGEGLAAHLRAFRNGVASDADYLCIVMKQKEHLPFFGIGPYYVGAIAIIAAIGMILSRKGFLDSGLIPTLKTPMFILGILVVLLGAFIWGYAFFFDRIDEAIKNNRLYTEGIYAWMRNPLYTGWMFIVIGVTLFAGNLWLLVLPFIFWALMAIMMRLTEEKWLHDRYGAEYDDYRKRVNRTWPWFPKN